MAYYAGAETESSRPEDGMSQACSLEFILGGVKWEKYQNSELKRTDPKWVNMICEDLASGLLPYESDNHLNWMTHVPGRPQNMQNSSRIGPTTFLTAALCLCESRIFWQQAEISPLMCMPNPEHG